MVYGNVFILERSLAIQTSYCEYFFTKGFVKECISYSINPNIKTINKTKEVEAK